MQLSSIILRFFDIGGDQATPGYPEIFARSSIKICEFNVRGISKTTLVSQIGRLT